MTNSPLSHKNYPSRFEIVKNLAKLVMVNVFLNVKYQVTFVFFHCCAHHDFNFYQ